MNRFSGGRLTSQKPISTSSILTKVCGQEKISAIVVVIPVHVRPSLMKNRFVFLFFCFKLVFLAEVSLRRHLVERFESLVGYLVGGARALKRAGARAERLLFNNGGGLNDWGAHRLRDALLRLDAAALLHAPFTSAFQLDHLKTKIQITRSRKWGRWKERTHSEFSYTVIF